MNQTQITTALFRNRISDDEIPFFRGAMIRLSGGDALFHNHNGDGFNYSYPLVQYKKVKGSAVVLGINQGAVAVERLFGMESTFSCQLGNRNIELELASIRTESLFSCCCESDNTYRIRYWLPLNCENYKEYQQAEGLIERIAMLEKILVGNVLSFGKGIGIHFEFPVICRILKLEDPGLSRYKNVELMSFSAVFRCNVFLPEYIGLGKSSSMGYGIVNCIRDVK